MPANPNNEGTSLASVLKDRTVLQTDCKSFALINQNWRCTRYFDGEEEFYHVAKDPHEHENLSPDSDHRKRMAGFARQLPDNVTEKGKPPHDLRSAFDGESFEWVERKSPKKSRERKSTQR